jgi:hypothetical protein
MLGAAAAGVAPRAARGLLLAAAPARRGLVVGRWAPAAQAAARQQEPWLREQQQQQQQQQWRALSSAASEAASSTASPTSASATDAALAPPPLDVAPGNVAPVEPRSAPAPASQGSDEKRFTKKAPGAPGAGPASGKDKGGKPGKGDKPSKGDGSPSSPPSTAAAEPEVRPRPFEAVTNAWLSRDKVRGADSAVLDRILGEELGARGLAEMQTRYTTNDARTRQIVMRGLIMVAVGHGTAPQREVMSPRKALRAFSRVYRAMSPGQRWDLLVCISLDPVHARNLQWMIEVQVLELLDDGLEFLMSLQADICQVPKELAIMRSGLFEPSSLGRMHKAVNKLLRPFFGASSTFCSPIRPEASDKVLNVLLANERVHPLTSLDALRARISPARPCLGYFSKVLGTQLPLLYVHAFLSADGVTRDMATIHAADASQPAPPEPKAAVFWSVNRAGGPQEIGLGGNLIKAAVQYLGQQYPSIERFATLSPVPLLSKWVLELPPPELARVLDAASVDLEPLARRQASSGSTIVMGKADQIILLKQMLADEKAAWADDATLAALLERPITVLAQAYLAEEKCQVYKFHVRSNGATLLQVNWMADRSPFRMQTSFGVMVSYEYDPNTMDRHFASVDYSIQGEGVLPPQQQEQQQQ